MNIAASNYHMTRIDYAQLSTKVRDALRASFTEVIAAHPDRSFYAFAIWTDDSLQFAHAAANTEEGLAATVHRYNREVDPEYGTTSTRNGMRWSYGDWEFFPIEGESHFAEVNDILQGNFNSAEEVFQEQIQPLWQALLAGFMQLENEGFFGTGDRRARVTLLLAGDIDEAVVDHWVAALNPPDVAERYLHWDYDAPDIEL